MEIYGEGGEILDERPPTGGWKKDSLLANATNRFQAICTAARSISMIRETYKILIFFSEFPNVSERVDSGLISWESIEIDG